MVAPPAARRPTTPMLVTRATRASGPAASSNWPPVTRPAANAGARTVCVTRPRTQPEAAVPIPYRALPTTDSANMPGSARIPIPSTRSPRRSTSPWSSLLTALLLLVLDSGCSTLGARLWVLGGPPASHDAPPTADRATIRG